MTSAGGADVVFRAADLRKRFGAREVFRAVSLAVARGEAVGVMGESGTGKTTLLRCLTGFERADEGTITANGVTLDHAAGPAAFRHAAQALRRQVGLVFQSCHLFSHRSVVANVMEGPVVVQRTGKAEARALALGLLEKVGVAHRAEAYPHELSGGEQQRVAIARALAMRPEVLLLDEPTSALDEARIAKLTELLRGLGREGLAIVAVTHDQSFAEALASRIVRLRDGELT